MLQAAPAESCLDANKKIDNQDGGSKYPHKSHDDYRISEDRKKKKKKKKRNIPEWVHVTIRTAIHLYALLTLFSVAAAFLYMSWSFLETFCRKMEVWNMRGGINSQYFDEFLVSSPSEFCNELIREMHLIEFPFTIMGLAMMTCLAIVEPQGSGFGGSSVAVFAKTQKASVVCEQSRGYSRINVHSPLFMARNNTNERYGYDSVLPMTDFLTYIDMYKWAREYDDIDEFERKYGVHALVVLTSFLEQTFSGMKIPKSERSVLAGSFNFLKTHGVSEVVKSRQSDIKIESSEVYANGELFDSIDIKALSRLLKKENLENAEFPFIQEVMNSIPQIGQGARYEAFIEALDFSQYKNESTRGELTQVYGQSEVYDICSPAISHKVYGYEPPGSFLSMVFDNYKVSLDRRSLTTNLTFYHEMHGLLRGVFKKLSDDYKAFKRDNDIPFTFDSNDERPLPKSRYGGNMFTMTDRRKGMALAVTATLGSSYGSFINIQDEKGGFLGFLNNLFDLDLKKIGELFTFDHALEPMIVLRGGQIVMSYAGVGGFLSRTADMANKMYLVAVGMAHGESVLPGLQVLSLYPASSNTTRGDFDLFSNVASDDLRKMYNIETGSVEGFDNIALSAGSVSLFANPDGLTTFPSGV